MPLEVHRITFDENPGIFKCLSFGSLTVLFFLLRVVNKDMPTVHVSSFNANLEASYQSQMCTS